MSDSRRRPGLPDIHARDKSLDPATDVANTLHELGLQLDRWAVGSEAPPDQRTAGRATSIAGAIDDEVAMDVAQHAVFVSLGIDAVISTNAMVGQRSLHDFLR